MYMSGPFCTLAGIYQLHRGISVLQDLNKFHQMVSFEFKGCSLDQWIIYNYLTLYAAVRLTYKVYSPVEN